MKKPFQIFNLFLVIAIAFTACKKDSTVTPTTGVGSTVSASGYGFDGGNSGKFTSTKAGITQTTVGGVSTFTISAIKDGSNETINLVALQKITTTGKITFGPSLSNGGIIISKDYTKPSDQTLNYSTDNSAGTAKGGGEINVTKISGNSIEGTFYAVAYNSTGKQAFVEQGTFSGTIIQ